MLAWTASPHCTPNWLPSSSATPSAWPTASTAVPNLALFRRDAPARPAVCLVEPSVVMVARGAKRLLVGGQGYDYGPERFLMTSIDLPANSEVVAASADTGPASGWC